MRRRALLAAIGGNGGGSTIQPIDINNYLTIEALEDGLTASLSGNACEYCVDGDGNWKTLAAGTATEAINTGQTLSFRGNLIPNSSNGIGTFSILKKCNLKGNCMSMLFGDEAADNYSLSGKNFAFCRLFNNCSNIVNVSENFLPATTLASSCYSYMFQNCTSLKTAPELSATNLAMSCYYSMFNGCTNLTTASVLPATTLVKQCYYSMFKGCTSLTTAPELPATTLEANCYYSMFNGCTNLTTAPELPATTLADYCYGSMFNSCTSLTTIPVLPATTLENNCYSSMFNGCTNLTTAPELPATTLADYCYGSMFQGCTKLIKAPALPATTLENNCYSYMFKGCTNLTTASVLPATTLVKQCYYYMFNGCKKLNYIKMLATDATAYKCLYNWVSGVSSTGTFVKNPAMNSLPTGTSGIPSGWTVVNDGEENSIFPMYLNTTYDSSRGLYYRDEDDLSRSLWEWIEQNREKDPDGLFNEDYIPDSIMSQCELYIDDVKVEQLFTEGLGSDNYWNWYPMNSKYYTAAFDPKRILEGGRIEIWED